MERTRMYYAGSECSIVAFFPDGNGLRLQVNRWPESGEPFEVCRVLMSWKEIAEMAEELGEGIRAHAVRNENGITKG